MINESWLVIRNIFYSSRYMEFIISIDSYFSEGFKPPTRIHFSTFFNISNWCFLAFQHFMITFFSSFLPFSNIFSPPIVLEVSYSHEEWLRAQPNAGAGCNFLSRVERMFPWIHQVNLMGISYHIYIYMYIIYIHTYIYIWYIHMIYTYDIYIYIIYISQYIYIHIHIIYR